MITYYNRQQDNIELTKELSELPIYRRYRIANACIVPIWLVFGLSLALSDYVTVPVMCVFCILYLLLKVYCVNRSVPENTFCNYKEMYAQLSEKEIIVTVKGNSITREFICGYNSIDKVVFNNTYHRIELYGVFQKKSVYNDGSVLCREVYNVLLYESFTCFSNMCEDIIARAERAEITYIDS